MLSQFNKTGQKEVAQIFSYQEKVLKSHESMNKSIHRISQSISKKLKRNIEDLLMTKAEEFRVKKELKDLFTNEVQLRNPQPDYKWVLNLRNNSNHFINFGSSLNPKWQLMVTPRDNREKIRNPEVMMNYNNTEYTFYTKDLYLKKKFSSNTYSNFTKHMSKTMNGFNQMNIKGEDLLHFEMENAKNLKGKNLSQLRRQKD